MLISTCGASASPATVVPYLGSSLPSLPNSSGHYTISVSGTGVPIFSYGGYSFAWFAFSGTVNVAVKFNTAISGYTLSPIRAHIPSTVTGGNTVNFTLNSPTKVCLKQVNGTNDYLYILADPLETGAPASSGTGIYNAVTGYGADSNYGSDATSEINSAITAANNAGGGIVYVPSGHYKIGNIGESIQLKSYVKLYLAPGALLQVPAWAPCCYHNSSIIYSESDNNAEIYGRGVIYGTGTRQSTFSWLYSSEAQTNFRIQDVMFLDSQTTGIRLQSSYATVENAKVITLPGRLADGIDMESANNITLDNNLILSTDDNTEFGTGTDSWAVIHPFDTVVITNNLFANLTTGHTFSVAPHMSIPGTSYMRNITYNNNDSIDTDAVIAIYPFGGTNIYNVTFQNFGAENIRGRPFEIWAGDCTGWGVGNCGTPARTLGYVSNVTVADVSFANFGSQDSQLYTGYSSAYMDQIHFNQDVIAGTPISSASAMHLDINSGYITGLTFETAAQTPSPNPLANGTYLMKNQYSGLVLDDPNFGTASGTQIIQWAENDGNNQKWRFNANASGFYSIQNVSNGLFATDVSGKLEMTPLSGSSSQLWTLASLGFAGSFTVANKLTGSVTDDANLSKTQGNGMITWPANGGLNQSWLIK